MQKNYMIHGLGDSKVLNFPRATTMSELKEACDKEFPNVPFDKIVVENDPNCASVLIVSKRALP